MNKTNSKFDLAENLFCGALTLAKWYLVGVVLFWILHYPALAGLYSLTHNGPVFGSAGFESWVTTSRYVVNLPLLPFWYAPSWIANLFGAGVTASGAWEALVGLVLNPLSLIMAVGAAITVFILLPLGLLGKILSIFKS